MLASTYPLVDVGDIIRLVGRGLYERGRGRARDGSVSAVVWDDASETLTGVVSDAGADPFAVSVSIEPTTRGFGTPFASGCGCPLGGDCSHVAALILNANGSAARRKTTELSEPHEAHHSSPEPDPTFGSARAGWWPTESDAATADGDVRDEPSWAQSAAQPSELAPPEPTRPPAIPAWKQALGPIAQPLGDARLRSDEHGAPTGSRTGTARVAAGPTAMGLQFELREINRRTSSRWASQPWRDPSARPPRPTFGAPTGVSAAASAARKATGAATHQLAVRPVLHNERGNWVRTGISWGTLSYQSNRLNLDPAQHRWFCEFGALYRASRFTYTGDDADWIVLDEFASPLLWQLFERAEALTIPLLGSTKNVSVRLAGHADLSLDATALVDAAGPAANSTSSEPDAAASATGLQLSPVLTVDGTAHGTAFAAAIGEHGVYLTERAEIVEPVRYGRRSNAHKVLDALAANEGTAAAQAQPAEHTTITIAPLDSPLSPELRALLGREKPLEVPQSEMAEFLEGYYPQLRRRIEVTSSDESVELPALQRPTLVLTATFRPKHVLLVQWAWEYLDGREPGDDEEAEAEISERLYDETHVEIENQVRSFEGIDAAEFCTKVLPRIERIDGVRVDVLGTRPDYRELTEAPELTITTVESDQTDWFDLGVIVTVGGRKVPFGPLFKAMAKGSKKLMLIDNSYLSLEHPALDKLRVLIAEAKALSEWETGVRISRYQASLWQEFEDLADYTEQAQSWRDAVSGLNALDSVEQTPVPDAVAATLRPYQVDGYNWLTFLWRHGLGGVLADDMGLGKTLQTLAMIAHAVEHTPAEKRRPFLVVAPTSVVSNWAAEAARFTPGLVAHTVKTTQAKNRGKKTLAELASGADIVVTSYALFRLDEAAYGGLDWAGLILDEAQFVKNHKARAHQIAKDFVAPFKLAITGTPMENNLLELWSMFSITAPGLFPSARKFTETYVRRLEKGIDKSENKQALDTLRRRIRPLMMRRTKELVAPELPAKHEQTLAIDLEPRHAKLYETVLQRERAKLFGLIDDMNKNRFIVFRSITLLRMLSLDASLVDPKYANIPSSKLDALLEQLDDVVAEGHRALVFSQFTSFLQKAAARLEERGIAYAYLDGSTNKRSEVIDSFKTGDAPVFLVSLKAGGFGLNLTEADYVFLLDPWWNPASEAQAVDRAHRIGQTKNVMVYRMVANGTIEEKVMALKEQKARVFSAVLDDDAAFSSALTADDIRGLLA